MILAGLALLAVGGVDLVRQFVPRKREWIGHLAVVVAVLVIGGLSGAIVPMFIAVVVAVAWPWAMPDRGRSRAGFWPAVALAVLCALSVVLLGSRTETGIIGGVWDVRSPFGPISFDLAVLVLGVIVFLLESGNLVVRTALAGERAWRPADIDRPLPDEPPAAPASAPLPPTAPALAPAPPMLSAPSGVPAPPAAPPSATAPPPFPTPARPPLPGRGGLDGAGGENPSPPAGTETAAVPGGFKGGRLIGPLERLLVFLLTLTTAYPLLAAMLAAKGIVRFPEISKDGVTGSRAEYFLVGSLVSWVMALGGAMLVWWAAHV
ncbi:hypothetical protein [Microbacterium sp.]|uniref:hypothetical protein n=1 Tax=Microbacterium sp. TaxID=51671 RepID=UPI00333F45BE